jgi:hypothetical protein
VRSFLKRRVRPSGLPKSPETRSAELPSGGTLVGRSSEIQPQPDLHSRVVSQGGNATRRYRAAASMVADRDRIASDCVSRLQPAIAKETANLHTLASTSLLRRRAFLDRGNATPRSTDYVSDLLKGRGLVLSSQCNYFPFPIAFDPYYFSNTAISGPTRSEF